MYHGSPFPTEDADITPDTDHVNLDRLVTALRELNARIRTEGVPEGVPFACDAEGLAAAQTWNLVTDAGDLDITFRPSGTQGYPDLRRDAVSADIYGVTVQIASLADVIRSKQAANRPKDQRVLPTLREILARRRDRRPRIAFGVDCVPASATTHYSCCPPRSDKVARYVERLNNWRKSRSKVGNFYNGQRSHGSDYSRPRAERSRSGLIRPGVSSPAGKLSRSLIRSPRRVGSSAACRGV